MRRKKHVTTYSLFSHSVHAGATPDGSPLINFGQVNSTQFTWTAVNEAAGEWPAALVERVVESDVIFRHEHRLHCHRQQWGNWANRSGHGSDWQYVFIIVISSMHLIVFSEHELLELNCVWDSRPTCFNHRYQFNAYKH